MPDPAVNRVLPIGRSALRAVREALGKKK